MIIQKTFPLILLSLFLGLSCKNESQLAQNKLLGKWIVREAQRDGEMTETLKGAYFHFIDETNMESNINRRTTSYNYSFENGLIRQSGAMNVDYQVVLLNDSAMVLTTNIRNYDFIFTLVRDTLSQDSLGMINK